MMTSLPEWLWQLAEAVDGVELFDAQERAELAEELHELYQAGGSTFVPLNELAQNLSSLMLSRLEPVGRVALGPTRPDVVENSGLLFVEANDPSHVLVALHKDVPPFLWFPAGKTAVEFDAAIAPYCRELAAPDELAMPRVVRAFIGTPGILEMGREELMNHLSMNPIGESLFWGSEHSADPWPETIDRQDLAILGHEARERMAQRDGVAWSMSFRSIASRAVITLEDHDGFYVIQVRYNPGSHHALLSALSEQFGLSWPADFPADVAAMLIGFYFEDAARLEQLYQEHIKSGQDDEAMFDLYALAAVCSTDVIWAHSLPGRVKSASLELQRSIADIALRRGYDFVAMRLLQDPEVDAALKNELLDRL